LLAHVPGTVGFTYNPDCRQAMATPFLDRRMRLGHDVLVLDRDHRDVDADHLSRLAGEVAGTGDDVFGSDLALIRGHLPEAGRLLLDTGHRGVAVDGGAAVARALCQRLRQVRRLDIAVIGVLDRAEQPVRLAERPNFLHLFRGQDIDLDADRLGDPGIVHILVPAVPGPRKTDVRDLGKADIHARFCLEFLVEADRILVQLPDGIGQVEERQKSRRMPCRPGGELLALDENGIGPALPGQVVERRNAHHATADHHGTRMCLHWTGPLTDSRHRYLGADYAIEAASLKRLNTT